MYIKTTLSVILFFVVNIFISAFAEPRTISIKECIQTAVNNHPEIRASMEKKNASIADYRAAVAGNSVQVNMSAKTVEYLNPDRSQGQVNIPGKDTTIGLFAGFGASYNLYDPRISSRINAARIFVDLSKINSVKTKETIVLNVKKSYYGYGLARDSSIHRKKLMLKFSNKLKKTKILYRIGQRSVLDVSKSEVDLETAKLAYEQSKNNENFMKTKLLAAMGIMDEDIEFSPAKIAELPKLKFSVDELYQISDNNSIELRMVRLQKRIRKLNIALQKSAHYPRVDIQAAFGFENRDLYLQKRENFDENFDGSNWSPTVHAGFTASMPIYSGGAINSRVDRAVSEYNATRYYEKKIRLNVRSMIRSSFQHLNELEKQINMSKLMVINAKKHMRLSQRYYETGVGSQHHVRNAELSVLNAELDAIKARYQYFITLSNLSNIVGLKEENLCQRK